MGAAPLKALAQDVARHPWSSLQDGLLVAMAMLVAALLALQYNLFWFIAELSSLSARYRLQKPSSNDPAGTLYRRFCHSSVARRAA
jgi:hypothetical protein